MCPTKSQNLNDYRFSQLSTKLREVIVIKPPRHFLAFTRKYAQIIINWNHWSPRSLSRTSPVFPTPHFLCNDRQFFISLILTSVPIEWITSLSQLWALMIWNVWRWHLDYGALLTYVWTLSVHRIDSWRYMLWKNLSGLHFLFVGVNSFCCWRCMGLVWSI